MPTSIHLEPPETDYGKAAQDWFKFGFNVIPIAPGTKRTAVKWDPWLADLSAEKITEYWTQHPGHELGCIVDDSFIVFDADSPESIAALAMLEEAFELTPNLTVKTTKGEHHFFKRAKGTFAKTDSHSTEKHPDRIDVKASRSMVVLAPSTGKEIEICEVNKANELEEIGQDFIDAVARQNGRPAPRAPVKPAPTPTRPASKSQNIRMIAAMLAHLDPDMGYEDWLHVLMATYHETGGSEEGFEIVEQWCSKGSKYKGLDDIRSKWNSFKSGNNNPITIATLCKMLEDKGLDWMAICSENQFEVCDYEVIHPEDKPATECQRSNE